MTQTSIMRNRTAPINSRVKGAAGERELVRILGEMTGSEWLRNLEQTRSGGADLISAEFSFLSLEVKRCERLCLNQWLAQATRQAKPHQTPALAFRQSRKPWVFLIPMTALDPTAPPAALATLDLDGFVWWLQRRKA